MKEQYLHYNFGTWADGKLGERLITACTVCLTQAVNTSGLWLQQKIKSSWSVVTAVYYTYCRGESLKNQYALETVTICLHVNIACK